jgi:hypothetical protein
VVHKHCRKYAKEEKEAAKWWGGYRKRGQLVLTGAFSSNLWAE